MPYVNYNKNFILSRIVVVESGCWEWQRAVGTHGYGVGSSGKLLAHRLAYEIFIGPIPQHLLVLHRCDNRRCCNPEHLFVGSHGDNSEDAQQKGRMKQPPPKLSNEQVQEIRERLAKGEVQAQIAKYYNVRQSHISRIKTGIRRYNTWQN